MVRIPFFEGDKDIVLTTHGLTSGSLTSPEVQGQLQLGVPGIRLPFRPSCQPHTIDMAYSASTQSFQIKNLELDGTVTDTQASLQFNKLFPILFDINLTPGEKVGFLEALFIR